MILKSHKDSTKKENFRPIALINNGLKIPNKILVNRIQRYIKISPLWWSRVHFTYAGMDQHTKLFHCNLPCKQTKRKKLPQDYHSQCWRRLQQNPTLLDDKFLKRWGIHVTCLNIIKPIHWKLTPNIKLNGVKKIFPKKQ